MIRMQNSGIIITVPPRRVSFFLRAGYRKLDEVKVEEKPKASGKEAEKKAEAPVEDTAEEEAEEEKKKGGK